MNGGRVAIIQTEAIKGARAVLGIFGHALPEVGAVVLRLAVAQLDAVAPADERAAEVYCTFIELP